jgi:hypothetical protein
MNEEIRNFQITVFAIEMIDEYTSCPEVIDAVIVEIAACGTINPTETD